MSAAGFLIFILQYCHSIFALSLTRFAFRNPNVITYGYATFDLLLQNLSITKQKSIGSFIVTLMNSPITKRCFVIPIRSEESLILLFSSTKNSPKYLIYKK